MVWRKTQLLSQSGWFELMNKLLIIDSNLIKIDWLSSIIELVIYRLK